MTASVLLARDLPLWQDALPLLDVRDNDEHSLIAYALAKQLLVAYPEAQESTVLPAILLHDIGWKTVDPNLILSAIGPGGNRPDLVRQHEIEGAKLAAEILHKHQPEGVDHAAVLAIIERHDSWKHATSLEDSLVKDADKAWRFTPHGVKTIAAWFDMEILPTYDMLEDFVMPQMLTDAGRAMAQTFLAAGRAQAQFAMYMSNNNE